MMVKLKRLINIFFSLIIFLCFSVSTAHAAKIVGLVQVRNEALVIEQMLRALAFYTDAIIVLDDASEDTTVSIIESVAQELSIVSILKNTHSAWQITSEVENRQKLLDAGRAVGGTHFMVIDADEILSANCAFNNYLKRRILALAPGMILQMPCVNMWNGITHWRNDEWCNPYQVRWLKEIAFCDDGVCSYAPNSTYGGPAKIIHVHRVPLNIVYGTTGFARRIVDNDTLERVLLHFKYANLDAISIKKNWYMCLEFIRAQEKNNNAFSNATCINKVYGQKEFECLIPDDEKIELCPVFSSWFAYKGIDFFCFTLLYSAHQKEIKRWFSSYGVDYFANLNLDSSKI
ncbi:MAG: glycosyltransferase family 2 protein [Candidatus Dependentiae bacterium]|nr:glycosyltransferase family 2 protein [Candidatus Dependentiae bacterium]